MTAMISSSTNSTRSTTVSALNLPTDTNEEDQLTRINLQALQNRDPYISKIVDQAQRVCVYKFNAEKREWERKDLEGTLFVYERMCEPFHGFVILSTVSRETFVQIIKPSMEFKHSPTYEAFLQYKVDVGDIYGIWFISKNDCPRVTECLKRLTEQAKEHEQCKTNPGQLPTSSTKSKDILSMLTSAQDKFQETKRKQESSTSETAAAAMPAVLLRLFSAQETTTTTTQAVMSSEERGEELKKTLGISYKSALSVTELEKQLLQPSSPQEPPKASPNQDNAVKPTSAPVKNQVQTPSQLASAHSHSIPAGMHPMSTGRLMTPADFQSMHITHSPVPIVARPKDVSAVHQSPQPLTPASSQFSKDSLRQLLVDILQNDEEFVTGLHNAYIEKQIKLQQLYS